MAVGIRGSPFGDSGHCGVVGLVVVPDDHRQPAASFAVGEPVGADTRLFERRNDLINHVFDSSLEVGRRLVLEGDHLCVHCAPPLAWKTEESPARDRAAQDRSTTAAGSQTT